MPVEIWRIGSTLVAHGATWDFHPGRTRASFQEAYDRNPITAERDYAANPPKSIQSALPDPDVVDRMINKERRTPMRPDGSFEPWFKGNQSREYYLHIDMSKSNDATGMGMAHFEMEEGKVVVDLIHNIDPDKTWELSFERVYQFVLSLKELGFNVKVTFDTWQSYYMVERLQNHNIPADFYSVDKGTQAYDTLISTLLMGQLDYYYHERFVTELKHIKLIGGTKYDHEKKRSKDTSDGVAGAVAKCVLANSGLALKDDDVEKVLHEDVLLNLKNDESLGVWHFEDTSLSKEEKLRKRVLRLDASDTELIMCLGWHDKVNDKLKVDEFLVWQEFTNQRGLSHFNVFIDRLLATCTLMVVSTNDLVPVEIIHHLQEMGVNVASPLSVGGVRYRKSRFTKTQKVTDFSIRMLVGLIKKGNITLPAVPQLIKDLKHISTENQKNRFYAGALAGWAEYATKEVSFGTSSVSLPRSMMARPETTGSIADRLSGNQAPVKANSRDEIRSMRTKYQGGSYDNNKTPSAVGARRAFPRSVKG